MGRTLLRCKERAPATRNGESTRPYRFNEFDLLAVSMQASTGSWHSFIYVPTKALSPKRSKPDEIETFQSVP
jgi:hypothetical protein